MRIPIFDFDGTLVDSDEALAGAFVVLGVAAERVTFGHELAAECARLGVSVDDYRAAYRSFRPRPFAGIEPMLGALAVWHVCSNKYGADGHRELRDLGWSPTTTWFADSFDGPKSLGPMLEKLDLGPERIVFIGDTDHDRLCADEVGCPFVLAGWNQRAMETRQPGDIVVIDPARLLGRIDDLGG